jgi:hypothetical protein
MAEGRSGCGDRARLGAKRHRGGFVMLKLPRHVIPKRLASGKTAFYYNVPSKYRALNCPVRNEPLGTDYAEMVRRAETLNGIFDEWDQQRKGLPISAELMPKYGTVDWLFREYKISKAYLEKVAPRSRQNYEWAMREVCDTLTKKGDRVGGRLVKTISPRGADKLYDLFIKRAGSKGERLRTGEKMVLLCRKAWRVVRRLFPDEFPKDVPNPWVGVTMKNRVKLIKAAVTRDQVCTFAHGCIEHENPEAAAVAVICFEWLQRPENVIAGHIKWTGYRNGKPAIRVEHHKTGAIIDHPLEADGVRFYADAERILAKLPKRGVPMILREVEDGKSKPFAFSTMQHIVQRMRKKLGLPSTFTFDACRHGGMTELEEAELTEGQGRALSAHRTQQSYAGYAKRTEARMLAATRKRHAHRLANETATSVQNAAGDTVQNEKGGVAKSA